MDLPHTRALGVRVEWREHTPSTNLALRDLAENQPDLPHGTVLLTDNQTAGRGRQGRSWSTPRGTALAISVLVRGFTQTGLAPGWLPLLAGSAVTRALRPYIPDTMRLGVKWPNDVHVLRRDGRLGPKLSGVLCEMLGDGSVVVGCGINVLIAREDLPTERAGSLRSIGGRVGGAESFTDPTGESLADGIAAQVVRGLLELVERAKEDPHGIPARVEQDSVSLGTGVRAHLPGGNVIVGRAVALAEDGSLIIERPGEASYVASAGDVEHLREDAGEGSGVLAGE